MHRRSQILLELKMLDLGVVPNTSHMKNVDKELSMMTPEDARKAKRKWRKISRKATKNFKDSKKMSPSQKKLAVLLMLNRERDT